MNKKDISNNSVEDILCNFYKKDINEISSINITEENAELDLGEDVGAEIIDD